MLKINLQLCFLLMLLNCIQYGAFFNLYANKQAYELQDANPAYVGYNNQPSASSSDYSSLYQQNLPQNSNYQQMYRYYYPPPYQQQQQHMQLQSQQPTQLWSGRPIVVEDDIQQYQQPSTTNISPTFYKQHSIGSVSRSSALLPLLQRNSKVLPQTVYNPQSTTRTAHFIYNNNNNHNNNNNNIVYHKDLRHQIDIIPESQHTQQDIQYWNNQQQQHQLLEQKQQQQQFNGNNTKYLRYNRISLGEDNAPDYREHFKRYLANNPRRIKPIY